MSAQTVELVTWTKPDERGMVRETGGRPVREVLADVVRALKANGHGDIVERLDYFSPGVDGRDATVPVPFWRPVAFAVTGGSEGHYVHAGVLDRDQKLHTLMLAKTFDGRAEADKLAAAVGEVLET